MRKEGAIILVDDDAEDQELVQLSLHDLGCDNEIKTFKSAEAALEFLYSSAEEPFLIVSDINMPKMDGLTFKRTIDKCPTLRQKCIPFVFLSTSTSFLNESCHLNIQGYFEKGYSMTELNDTMRTILNYWKKTKHNS